MTNTTPPSPAAQAVVTAIERFDWESGYFTREDIWLLSREVTAAALRAVADHCVPDDSEGHWVYVPHVLALAAELEGENAL